MRDPSFLQDIAGARALAAMLPATEKRKELRRRLRITREQFAAHIGVETKTFDRYERGELIPEDYETLEKLVAVYRILEGELEEIPETKRALR